MSKSNSPSSFKTPSGSLIDCLSIANPFSLSDSDISFVPMDPYIASSSVTATLISRLKPDNLLSISFASVIFLFSNSASLVFSAS